MIFLERPNEEVGKILRFIDDISHHPGSHVSAQVTPEARWIAQTGSEVVFVFVHGIFSDSDAGWRHPDGTF